MATKLYIIKEREDLGPGWLLDPCRDPELPLKLLTLDGHNELPMAIDCCGVLWVGPPLAAEPLMAKPSPFRNRLVFIRSLVGLAVPFLGIGSGAQLLARALLGDIAADLSGAPGPDRLALNEAAAADRLFSGITTLPVLRWPAHRFSLPKRALLLAGSTEAPDIFRLAEAAWGVLPHPELTPPGFQDWLREEPEMARRAAASLEDLASATAAQSDQQRETAYAIMHRFLALTKGFCHIPPPLAGIHPGPDAH